MWETTYHAAPSLHPLPGEGEVAAVLVILGVLGPTLHVNHLDLLNLDQEVR